MVSEAATTRGNVPPKKDLSVDSRETFSSPLVSPLLKNDSYFVFNLRSVKSGYHLERVSDNTAAFGFKISKVPMEIVTYGTGSLAYVVQMSESDRIRSRCKSHETLWPPKNSQESGISSKKGKDNLGNFDQSDRDSVFNFNTEKRPPVINNDAGNSTTVIQLRAMSKVNGRLRAQRHFKHHLHVTDNEGNYIPGTKNMFLVNDRDIRDVVAIVVAETLKAKGSNRRKSKWIKENCTNLPGPQLDRNSNIIRLPSGTVAEPATTISIPRISYASADGGDLQMHTRIRGEDSDAMTTVITQKNITEITWLQGESRFHDLGAFSPMNCSQSVSECSSPAGKNSIVYSLGRQQSGDCTSGGFILHHYNTSMDESELLSDIARRHSSIPRYRATRMTSFPRLLSRHCTNEWVTPPPPRGIDAAMLSNPSTLYRHGVDAHSGRISNGQSNIHQQGVVLPHYQSVFTKNPFSLHFEDDDKATVGGFPSLTGPKGRFGVSIGSASHRRRSSQVPYPSRRQESQDSFFPTLMDKIRQGSHRIFHHHHSRKGSDEISTPPNTEREGYRQGSEVLSRESMIKYMTPLPPRPDSTGIYEAMTGTRLVVSRCRNGTCSEDNRPHVCENDYQTPVPAASPM